MAEEDGREIQPKTADDEAVGLKADQSEDQNWDGVTVTADTPLDRKGHTEGQSDRDAVDNYHCLLPAFQGFVTDIAGTCIARKDHTFAAIVDHLESEK